MSAGPAGEDNPMQRRAFLRNAGMFALSACGGSLAGLTSPAASPLRRFKLGVISDELTGAAEVADKAKMRLALEDEGSCNVGSGHELAAMLKLLPAANLGANWDVGNGYWHGEVSYPAGYAALDKKRIWHMHLKDVRCGAIATAKEKAEAFRKQGTRVSEQSKCQTAIVGTGQVDLAGQLRALLRDGYEGTMSLEPEYEAPSVTHFEATRRSLEGLLKIMATAAG